ncbi:hypothetical protein KBZ08_08785 [Cyanobium sp. Candia 9D4]|uniref:DUF6339 family protein n=1 Tax=Cyanobium sp. Candia 9D4 TaxID=2823707 RepID=UPI0020CD042A|nr:DUF6339 family protein [Cyanobium sp. Candia 9D4]MCP9934010.1 hypothetical protein [Cyanobium sp. Candia 9D4]
MKLNLTEHQLLAFLDAFHNGACPNIYDYSDSLFLDEPLQFNRESLVKLKKEIAAVIQEVPRDWDSDNSGWAPYDGTIACLLHSTLTSIPPRVSSSKGFWRFLSGLCCEFVERRYGYSAGDSINLNHFGNMLRESILPRLWLRAELSYDEGNQDDCYWLTKLGGSDFWSSFVIRRVYAQSRQLVRALACCFYEPETTRFRYGDKVITAGAAVRLLGPRLRLQHALTPFELLDYENCVALIDLLLSELNLQKVT